MCSTWYCSYCRAAALAAGVVILSHLASAECIVTMTQTLQNHPDRHRRRS